MTRKYREVTLPAGTFRCYEDEPTKWVEVPRTDGYETWLQATAAKNPESELRVFVAPPSK